MQEQKKKAIHQKLLLWTHTFLMKNKDAIICILIITLALFIRLQNNNISIPLAGYEAQEQVHIASVARYLRDSQFDILYPRIHDETGLSYENENTQRYYFEYFPSYPLIFGLLYRYIPLSSVSLATYGRVTTVIFSLLVILMLYYISLKEQGRLLAISTALVYAAFPYYVYYSQVVLPETMVVACALFAIVTMYMGLTSTRPLVVAGWYIISLLSMALSITTSLYAALYIIPIVFLFGRRYDLKVFKQFHLYLYVLLACMPAFAWQYHVWLHTNTLIPTTETPPIADYIVMLFQNIIGEYLLGIYLLAFVIMGLLIKQGKYLLHAFMIVSIAIISAMLLQRDPSENAFALTLPGFAIATGLGINNMLRNHTCFAHPTINFIVVPLVIVMGYHLSHEHIKYRYEHSSTIVQMADIVEDFTDIDDRIATQTDGESTLLYLANRTGRSKIDMPLEKLVEKGYTHVVITQTTDKNAARKQYGAPVFENETFALFAL